MQKVLLYRSHIYGLMAIWIMLFHIHGVGGASLPSLLHYLSPIIARGNMGVDVFLFLSGFCLTLSYQKDSNLGHFYKKRMKRLLVPYLLICTPIFVWKNCHITGEIDLSSLFSLFKDITGVSYWVEGMQWTWFVHGIILCYLLFPLLYKCVSKSILSSILLLLFLYFFLVVLYYTAGGWYVGAGNAYLRIPIFVWGIVAAQYYSTLSSSIVKSIVIISALLGLLIIGFLIFKKMDFFIRLVLALFVPVILWLLSTFISKSHEKFPCLFRLRILEHCGSFSLEIYLSHILFINILLNYNLLNKTAYWAYIIIPVVAYVISSMVNKISMLLVKPKVK